MTKLTKHLWFRAVAAVLVISFITLDIAWAKPSTPNDTTTLSVPSLFNQILQSELAAKSLAISGIAKYLLGDEATKARPGELKFMQLTISDEVKNGLGGIDLSHVAIKKNGIVLIPYKSEYWGRCLIQVALKGNPAAREMLGFDGAVSDKYIVKVAVKSRVAAAPAVKVKEMMMAGKNMSDSWRNAVRGGKIRVPFKRGVDLGGDEIELGVRIGRDGISEYYGTNLTTGQNISGEVRENSVGDFVVQLNEFRGMRPGVGSKRTLGMQSDMPSHEQKCQFACRDKNNKMSLLVNQPLAEFELNGTIWRGYNNAAPFEKDGHFLLVPDIQDPNQIREQELIEKDILDILTLSRKSENVLIFFNSRHAGSSVNHIHFQGVAHTQTLPIEKVRFERVFDQDGVTVSRSYGYPAPCTLFESEKDVAAAKVLWSTVDTLQARKIPFNLLFIGKKAYLFPRNIDSEITAEFPTGTLGSMEMAGKVIVVDRATRDTTDAGKIKEALGKSCLTEQETTEMFNGIFTAKSEAAKVEMQKPEAPSMAADEDGVSLSGMATKNKIERFAFIMLKPDGVSSRETILKMLRDRGIEVVFGSGAVRFTRAQAESFYAEHAGRPYFDGLVSYVTSGDVEPIIVRSSKENAIADVRAVVGPTDGIEKSTGKVMSDTIRGDLMTDADRTAPVISNRIHASDSVENVMREASIAFGKDVFDEFLSGLPAEQRGVSEIGSASSVVAEMRGGSMVKKIAAARKPEAPNMEKSAATGGKQLILYSGPSATGKTPIWEQIQKRYPERFSRIVLYTSRGMRPGEVDGVDYHFKTPDEIVRLEKENRGSFITLDVNGDLQGIDLSDAERALQSGKTAIAEVSVDWAARLRERYSDKVYTIFIAPITDAEITRRSGANGITPDEVIYNEMMRRQNERNAEKPTDESKRIKRAKAAMSEMARRGEYDAVIVNDKLRDISDHQQRWDGEEGAVVVEEFMSIVRSATAPVVMQKPEAPNMAADEAGMAPEPTRIPDSAQEVSMEEQVKNYEKSDWAAQSRTRERFVPYVLDPSLIDKAVEYFHIMLEAESARISIEIRGLEKNLAFLEKSADERLEYEQRKDRLVGLLKVIESLDNGYERIIRVVKICREYFLNPSIKSRDLHNMLNRIITPYSELLEDYRIIQRLRVVQDLFIYNSPYQRLVGYIKEQLIMRKKLEDVFTKTESDDVVPFAVEFHLALGCNALCSGCPNIIVEKDGKKKFVKYHEVGEKMTLEKVKLLIDTFVDMGVERISFAGGGEPFVSPFLMDAIQYARERSPSINLALYTNGIGLIKLPEQDRVTLVKSLNRLRVSMDASDAASWSEYKGHPKERFYELWDAIGSLTALRDQHHSAIKIGASCIVAKSCQDRKVLDFIGLCVERNLNFCDIKALAESDDTKSVYKSDSNNLMKIIDEIMAAKQRGDYGTMDIHLEDEFTVAWYAWKLGVDKAGILTPHQCWMARVGRKVTIGPYGGIYPCSDAANPGILKVLKGEPRMAVLRSFGDRETLKREFFSLWHQSRGKRDSFNPPTHPYCVPSNDDYNVAIEKLHVDWDYGIPLEDQPIYPESYAYLESRGIAGTGSIKTTPMAVRYVSANRQNLARALSHLRTKIASYKRGGHQLYNVDKNRLKDNIAEFVAIGNYAVPTLVNMLNKAKDPFLTQALLIILAGFGPDAGEAVPKAIEIYRQIQSIEHNDKAYEEDAGDEREGPIISQLGDAILELFKSVGPGASEAVELLANDFAYYINYMRAGKDLYSKDFTSSVVERVELMNAIGKAAAPLVPLLVEHIKAEAECSMPYGLLKPNLQKIVNHMSGLGRDAAPLEKYFVNLLYSIYARTRLSKEDFSDFAMSGKHPAEYRDEKGVFRPDRVHEETLAGNILFYLGRIGPDYAFEYIPLILEIMDYTNSEYILKAAAYALSKIGATHALSERIELTTPNRDEVLARAILTKYKDNPKAIDPAIVFRALSRARDSDTKYYLLDLVRHFDVAYPDFSKDLVALLERTGDPQFKLLILAALSNSKGDLTEFVPSLIEVLHRSDLPTQTLIAKVIIKSSDLSGSPEIEKLLRTIDGLSKGVKFDGLKGAVASQIIGVKYAKIANFKETKEKRAATDRHSVKDANDGATLEGGASQADKPEAPNMAADEAGMASRADEGALTVIALSDVLQKGPFDVATYRRQYKVVAAKYTRLEFESTISYSTALRDLQALTGKGILRPASSKSQIFEVNPKNGAAALRAKREAYEEMAENLFGAEKKAARKPEAPSMAVEKPRVSPAGMAPQTQAVTELFEIVENTINNERARVVLLGNQLLNHLSQGPNANPMRFEDPAAEIKARVDEMVDCVINTPVSWDDEGAKEMARELNASMGQLEADTIVGSIIILARRAKFQNQKLIIGLETDWISGYNEKGSMQKNAITSLVREIGSLDKTLRSMGLDNIIIVHKGKDELARAVSDEATKTSTKLTNVVLFGSNKTLNSETFSALRSTPAEARAFMAAVDPSELDSFYKDHKNSMDYQLKIQLMEMLCMALEMAVGKEPPQLPIIASYDKVLRTVTFLPNVEPADYEELRHYYNAQRKALQAA